jgi:hypothetical protein
MESDMKHLKLLLVLLTLAFSQFIGAEELIVAPGNSSLETKICMAAFNNDLSKLKSTISKVAPEAAGYRGWKLRSVARKYKCNNTNIVKFARRFDATNTVNLLAKYLGKTVTISRQAASATTESLNPEKHSGIPTIIYGSQ